MQNKINELKEKYKKELDNYSEQIRAYINLYIDDNSDYLIHRRSMENYYRGAYNALIELEKNL